MQPLPLRAVVDIFSVMQLPQFAGVELHVSCYEIYGGKLFDLLNARNKLEVREDSKRQVQVGSMAWHAGVEGGGGRKGRM